MRGLLRHQPPARAGNFLRYRVDTLFKAHQLPVVGVTREGKTGFARQADHNVVGAQRIAEHPSRAKRRCPAFQIPQQRRTDALALPAVIDRYAKLEACGVVLEPIAGFADDGLDTVDHHHSHDAEPVALAGMDEMIEFGRWQFAHRTKEAIVARANSERPEVTLQRFGIVRLDKAHRQGLAAAQPQDIGVLPEFIKAKRNHRKLPMDFAGAPLTAAPARRRSSPPERLLGLADDIAPRQSDVMQFAIGPLRQFVPLLPAVMPDMKRVADPGQKAKFMMIYHRFRGTSGHFYLLNLICWQ